MEEEEIGYENFYEGDWSYNSDEDKQGTTPSGETLGDLANAEPIVDDDFEKIVFGDDNQVFGLPYKYSPLADPLMRIFEETFESDNNIAFINVGTARINHMLFMKLSADGANPATLFTNSGIIPSLFSGKDPRLISFKPNFSEFFKYAEVFFLYIWGMMDMQGAFQWSEYFDDRYADSGIPFYCTKNTSVSEGMENTYGQSKVTDNANQNALEQRENYLMYGVYGGVKGDDSTANWADIMTTKAKEKAGEILQSVPLIGEVAASFFNSNKGAMQYDARIWSDSQVSNNYSLNFKFYTPYGNKLDIFRNVYFPFGLLYTAAQPRQNGKFAYKEPFLVRVSFPG